jgi:hypothetical protein
VAALALSHRASAKPMAAITNIGRRSDAKTEKRVVTFDEDSMKT